MWATTEAAMRIRKQWHEDVSTSRNNKMAKPVCAKRTFCCA
jgi:hypothetical protein